MFHTDRCVRNASPVPFSVCDKFECKTNLWKPKHTKNETKSTMNFLRIQ